MEENFNTINLEYSETRKVSTLVKILAFVLVIIFISVPMFEFLVQFKPMLKECTYGIVGTCGCIIP